MILIKYLMGKFSLGYWAAQLNGEDHLLSLDISETKDELWQFLPKGYPDLREISDPGLSSILEEGLETSVPGSKFPFLFQPSGLEALVLPILQEIPKGQTRTYQQIADALNKPKSVRPVASAIAKNSFAIVVPCHRVLPKAGVGKYKWGSGLKTKLLERENAR